MELWKELPGYEGWYEVSDAGRVRSLPRLIVHSDGRKRNYPSVVLSQYTDDFGYAKVTINRNGKDWRAHVHHLVALAFHGPRPGGMWVCHYDGNRLNNRPENLRYDTPAGNHADSKRHGTSTRPSTRKLTDETVAAIRAARGLVPLGELALRYGTSKTHVCNIQRGNRRAA